MALDVQLQTAGNKVMSVMAFDNENVGSLRSRLALQFGCNRDQLRLLYFGLCSELCLMTSKSYDDRISVTSRLF